MTKHLKMYMFKAYCRQGCDKRTPKLVMLLGLWLFTLSANAAERWQVVILGLANNAPVELSLNHDLQHSITQGLTRAFNAADIDVHSSGTLGLPDCRIENCNKLDSQAMRQQILERAPAVTTALYYQFTAFKQRQNNVSSWHFELSGRLIELNSGNQLDAYQLSTRPAEPAPHCITECLSEWLNQQLSFMTQELGAVLADKLQAIPRQFDYQFRLQNFTPDELQQTADFLQHLEGMLSLSLEQEYEFKSQWLHQLASRDYHYVSRLSAEKIGTMLAQYFDTQGMQTSIRYEQKPGLFILSRRGLPYQSRYLTLLAVICLAALTSMWYLRQRRRKQLSDETAEQHLADEVPASGRHSDTTQSNAKQSKRWALLLWSILTVLLLWHFRAAYLPAGKDSVVADTSKTAETTTETEPQDNAQSAADLQEQHDWLQASKINTLQSYQIYLNRWPQGRYLIDASAALKTKSDDLLAWDVALDANNSLAYQAYLDGFPAGDFRPQARQKLTLLLQSSRETQQRQDLLALADSYYYQQKNFREARYYYQQAADLGEVQAQFQLAQLYEQAQGTSQDLRLAADWYHKAAQQGHAQAQLQLAYMYSKGQGVSQDHQQAIHWYQQAATQGLVLAQYNLAYIYAQGQVTRRNYQQAAYWYQQAADQGDADAQNNLGKLYENGQGVTKDLIKARNLYRQAADQGHQLAKINLRLLNP